MIFCEVYSFHKPCCSSSKCLHTNRSHTYSQGGNSILLTYGLPHANYIWPATCQLHMACHMPITNGLPHANCIWPAVFQLHMACCMPITYGLPHANYLQYVNYIWPATCQLHMACCMPITYGLQYANYIHSQSVWSTTWTPPHFAVTPVSCWTGLNLISLSRTAYCKHTGLCLLGSL